MRARIFPLDNDVTDEQILDSLKKLNGSIHRYTTSDGKKLIQIVKWWSYQTPSWAAASKFEAPIGWVDRIKVHVVGNSVRIEGWDTPGGFIGSRIHRPIVESEVKSDDDGEIESEGDNQPQYCANPKTGEYEQKEPYHYEPADELFCDDIFLQVTGFYPAIESAALVRKTILLIAEKNHTKDKAKIAGILRPFYLDWIGRKNKHGGHYSKTKIEWLTEWAATGEIPKANDGKPPDTFKQQSPEEIVRLKAELRKGKK
jgi:hypothetical protein